MFTFFTKEKNTTSNLNNDEKEYLINEINYDNRTLGT